MENIPTLDEYLKSLMVAPARLRATIMQSGMAQVKGRPQERMLLTGAEFARQGSFSTMTLWRLVKSGAITPVKIRGSTRYRFSDLLKLAAGEVQS